MQAKVKIKRPLFATKLTLENHKLFVKHYSDIGFY